MQVEVQLMLVARQHVQGFVTVVVIQVVKVVELVAKVTARLSVQMAVLIRLRAPHKLNHLLVVPM